MSVSSRLHSRLSDMLNPFNLKSKVTVKVKHFNNEYEDYCEGNATFIKNQKELSPQSKIVSSSEEIWNSLENSWYTLDFSDYSVYTGTAGIALLKLKKFGDDQKNLKEAKTLLCLDRLRNRRHTFICGDTGPLAIGAVICNKLGEKEEAKHHIDRLIGMQGDAVNVNSKLPNEILYGRAGYLYSLLYVNKHISPPPIDGVVIRNVIEALLFCGKQEVKSGNFQCPLMYQWHESHYLGAAHGLSGILYMLLQAKEFITKKELLNLIKPTIDYLHSLKFPSGNFPSSLSSETDKYVQWCHGAPGFLYLFSIAYKVFDEEKYLQWALECGDVVWEKGLLRKGYSICHGVAGNAYCFLELYQITKDIKHLYRAVKFAEWCIDYTRDHEEHFPDRPHSLFEGTAGRMYLILDIQKPLEAKFPGFTL